MPKSVYFTDEAYQQITEAARQCGFRVSRGRGSQIALFVVAAANKACSRTGCQRAPCKVKIRSGNPPLTQTVGRILAGKRR